MAQVPLSNIKHVVMLMLENRSLDNLFGHLYGAGPQGEGTHIEALRKLEYQLENGYVAPTAAADLAKPHLEALFDLHGSVSLERRTQAVTEGTRWLQQTYPRATAAYQKKHKFL